MKLRLQNMWHYYIFRTYSVHIKIYNWNKLVIFIHVIAISWHLIKIQNIYPLRKTTAEQKLFKITR